MRSHPHSAGSTGSRRALRRSGVAAVFGVAILLAAAGCADFSSEPPSYGAQPSLTPRVAKPVEPSVPRVGQTSSQSPSSPSSSPQSPSEQSSPPDSAEPEDPCRPADQAIIAACLDAPWGLAVLPGGQSALVGERTSGRILTIAPQQDPVEFATIDGIDAAGSGGLLGIALSPSYDEDRLVYAYVTTRTDNRVLRIASGDTPKPILTGIPRGTEHNGGRIEFGQDGFLYVGTGDTGDAELATDPDSLAGKVLRVDQFGKPAKGNPDAESPVYASGFTDVVGMCSLGKQMGALDHRKTADILIGVTAGADHSSAKKAAVWTWKASEGGASDCSLGTSQLGFGSLDAERVVGIATADGAFSGTPEVLMEKKYGRVRTLTLGGAGTEEEVFWATTSNKDGSGRPGAGDDLVFVVKASASGGGDGGND